MKENQQKKTDETSPFHILYVYRGDSAARNKWCPRERGRKLKLRVARQERGGCLCSLFLPLSKQYLCHLRAVLARWKLRPSALLREAVSFYNKKYVNKGRLAIRPWLRLTFLGRQGGGGKPVDVKKSFFCLAIIYRGEKLPSRDVNHNHGRIASLP